MSAPGAEPRRAAVTFIFITVLLDMLAFGMIVPVLPTLVKGFMGGDTARAAHIFGLFGTTWAVMQFFFSPVLGALSDRFGRRPVILLSNFGLGADYIFMALAPSIEWLFIGRTISGLTSASVPTAGAYIADVTPPEKRAAAFGIIGSAFGVGFVVGPSVGGLLGAMDPRMPFWVSGMLSLLNALYGLFVLPESLPPEKRSAFSWKRANPVGSLALLRSRERLLGLAAIFFLYFLAHEALPSVFVLYATYRYGWDERTVGLSLAAVGVCAGLVQGVLVRRVVPRFGERRTALFGLACGIVGFAIYGLAPTGPLLMVGIPIFTLLGLASPSVQGMMTHRVGPEDQGKLQGAVQSLRGVSGLIGPALFTTIFALAIGPLKGWDLPGAPYLLSSALVAVALVIAWKAAHQN